MNIRTLVMLIVVLTGENALQAQDYYRYDPYATPKRPAFQIHDHLQILVVERSQAQSTTDLRTDRRSRMEFGLDEWLQFSKVGGGKLPRMSAAELATDPGIDLDARFRVDNTGRTSRAFDLTFTVTAEVKSLLPNGTLVIEAWKRRQVNGETESIRLSGTVAPNSVGPNNVVSSSDIANLDIEYDGEGSTGDQAKQGWLSWLLSKLWPF